MKSLKNPFRFNKKVIITILLIVSTILNMSVNTVKADNYRDKYYEDGFYPIFFDERNKDIFEGIKDELPLNTTPVIKVNECLFPFNYRLWFSKNIVVYGDYSTVNSRPNDFKAESDSPYKIGYYSKNGIRGEYRYHGFDVAGNRYNNTWWTIDVDTGSSINDNIWLYRPWNKETYKLENISPYNEAAEGCEFQEDQKTRAWINRPIQKDGVTLTFENAEASHDSHEKEAYRYIHIMSPPSINYPGEGKAWHMYNNQLLYRTFTIDKLEHMDKLMTDVSTKVKILTCKEDLIIYDFGAGEKGNTPKYLDSEVEVQVEVQGILQDEDYFNDPVKKTVRYTRDDISDWTISLGSNIEENIKSIDYNKGRTVFTLKYKVASILNQSIYTLNGNAKVNFKNNKSNENSDSVSLIFSVQKISLPSSLPKDKLMTDVSAELEILASPKELTIKDYRENNTKEYLDGHITVPFRVTGTLLDNKFYNNPEEKQLRYNREDIHSWTIGLNGEIYNGIKPDDYHKNMGNAIITLKFKRRDILQKETWQLNAYVEPIFFNGEKNQDTEAGSVKFTVEVSENEKPLPELPPDTIEEPELPPIIIEPNCQVPEYGFDIAPFLSHDDTDFEYLLSRRVYINGEEVNDIEFFSGNYIFGINNEGIKKIDILYESTDGIITSTSKWTYIYSTKPVAQFKLEGTFKENRKLTAIENCNKGNTQIVLDKYPIVSYNWSFSVKNGGEDSLKQRSTGSDKYLEFLYREPGVYSLGLTVTNSLGRVSDVYVLDYVIYEDTPPAIEMNIWNGVLTRGEELKLYYSTSSVDKDNIVERTLELYYDSNNDGICDQLIKIFPDGKFTGYSPDKLGKYKIVAKATEEFGQETLPEFVVASDKKHKILEREFWVDNLAPMTDMYINMPAIKPEIDVYIMLDKNLDNEKKQYIIGNRVNFSNFLRRKNILPKIETWDMKTYQYSQTTSDIRYTGGSYPSSSISYSSGGYLGTLNLDRSVDNGEYCDFGSYETKTESKEFARYHSSIITKTYWDGKLDSTSETSPAPSGKFISEDGYSGSIPIANVYGPYNYCRFDEYYSSKEFTRYHSNTVTDYYSVDYNFCVDSVNSSSAPSSVYISEDGYYGNIYRVGTNGPYNRTDGYTYYNGYYCWYVQQTFEAVYCGSLEKLKSYKVREEYETEYRGILTKSVKLWIPNIEWVSDYIGYYSGTVYKNIKEPYVDPFRATSEKYIIYISETNINELLDLEEIMSKTDAYLILVGNDKIKDQVPHTHYVSKNKPIENIMDEILDYIAVNSPAIEKHYVLAGIDTFDIKTMDFDEEKDPIIERKFQYVQTKDYFDNSMGMESFAVEEFSNNDNWVDDRIDTFDKVGEFCIFRRIKDLPIEDPNFTNYSYYSGIPELRIYSHRRPIAKASLDWDYSTEKEVYETKWICQSYDPDHEFSREDKGIVNRKIMFRRIGGEWHYYIPEELPPGNYELQYYVKDIEGIWSYPFVMNFTLRPIPNIQILDAKIRALDPKFRSGQGAGLNDTDICSTGIPASEYIEIYDIWTRYPSNVNLELALYSENIRVGPVKTINLEQGTGVRTENDIKWNNIDYEIPNIIEDGNYIFKIKAIDCGNLSKYEEKCFPITINTPINLIPVIPETVMTGITMDIKAKTEKYVHNTQVVLFYGEDNTLEKSLGLTSTDKDNKKEWKNTHVIHSNIPEGTYMAAFTATTPSGKSETKIVEFGVQALSITNVSIEGYWNHWKGQVDIFGKQLTSEPHRFLSLERIKIAIHIEGFADKIEIRFSEELESMEFNDEYGNSYDYKEDFDFQYVIFPKVFFLDNKKQENDLYWEYILPLAKSTKSWDNIQLKEPYKMEVTAWNGTNSVKYLIDDINITGNIFDLTYIQPIN